MYSSLFVGHLVICRLSVVTANPVSNCSQPLLYLPYISKVHVLLVSQVAEVSICMHPSTLIRVNAISPAILIPAVRRIYGDGNHRQHIASQHSTHTKWIQRCLISLEELRCDDVADTVCDKDQRIDGDFLRMARSVCRVDTEGDDVRAKVEVRAVQRCETSIVVVKRQNV